MAFEYPFDISSSVFLTQLKFISKQLIAMNIKIHHCQRVGQTLAENDRIRLLQISVGIKSIITRVNRQFCYIVVMVLHRSVTSIGRPRLCSAALPNNFFFTSGVYEYVSN